MKRSKGFAEISAVVSVLGIGGWMSMRLATAPPSQVEISGFATDLKGRTENQKFNARKAANALNGVVIPPGAVFSFNHVVKSWSQDQGYVKAPVSYDGELIQEFGGGVCQTSSTLYNAALLAGLPILERHSHVFASHYVPPGRDAAVAQKTIDLRFKNPYSWPIHIQAETHEDRLDIRLFGAAVPTEHAEIYSTVLSSIAPQHLTRVAYRNADDPYVGRAYVRNPGATGCRVVTYRVFSRNGRELRRERLADDTYQAMNHIVQVDDERD